MAVATLVLHADDAGVAAAVAQLRAGGLVAVPSETVYGLAARADDPEAVAAIYRAKGRPDFNPLIVHVSGAEAAERLAVFDGPSRILAETFWPGPLTLVLPQAPGAPIAPAVTAGLGTIALRCPAHPVFRAVLAGGGLPLAAPSANRSGAISPTTAAHVVASLGGRIPMVLDGGPSKAGVESTIVAMRQEGAWEILRPGPITAAQIAEAIGEVSAPRLIGGVIEAPGQLASHYAPKKPLRLNAHAPMADEFLIGFGPVCGAVTLSSRGDLAEAASRLYACLHLADASILARIAVVPIPNDGIGAAINDRLSRAATA